MDTFINFLIGIGFNLGIAFIIIRYIYYPQKHNKNYVFTFLAFNTIIFFVLTYLPSSELSVGAGFGLFAIFSLLRYRTNPMPIRDMTYLFVISALPIINSILLSSSSWLELLTVNGVMIGVMYMLEQGWGFHYETSKRITYEKIELIRPENYELLLADLQQRTGLPITRCEVGQINFLRDTAQLKIYYNDPNKAFTAFGTEEDSLLQTELD
ncbi:MAG: DUF4956 domain-containing protein [Chloroflexi bacterium]|nr:MAG: DUF4956 domain-containing protein [Chloroflexota bacterium]